MAVVDLHDLADSVADRVSEALEYAGLTEFETLEGQTFAVIEDSQR